MIHEGDLVYVRDKEVDARGGGPSYRNHRVWGGLIGVVDRAEFQNFITVKFAHIEEPIGPFFAEQLDVFETFEDTVRRILGEEYL